MFKIVKTAVAISALSVGMAQAATVITFGGQAATDGSVLTSSLVSANNQLTFNPMNPAPFVFIETFDRATQMGGLPAGLLASNSNIWMQGNQGCAFNSFNSVTTTIGAGGFGIQKGTTSGVAAAPGGPSNTSCFGFGPAPANQPQNQGTPQTSSSVKIDYAPLLTQLAAFAPAGYAAKIDYLGFFYGSVDTYNSVALYNGSSLMTNRPSFLSDGIISGTEILAQSPNCGSGNQTSPCSNQYININFDAADTFTAFEFRTTGVAFELDNVVTRVSFYQVSEPGVLGLVGLGLVGLGFAARRRKAA